MTTPFRADLGARERAPRRRAAGGRRDPSSCGASPAATPTSASGRRPTPPSCTRRSRRCPPSRGWTSGSRRSPTIRSTIAPRTEASYDDADPADAARHTARCGRADRRGRLPPPRRPRAGRRLRCALRPQHDRRVRRPDRSRAPPGGGAARSTPPAAARRSGRASATPPPAACSRMSTRCATRARMPSCSALPTTRPTSRRPISSATCMPSPRAPTYRSSSTTSLRPPTSRSRPTRSRGSPRPA